MKAIKLHFTTPVHFGRGREEPDKSELIYHSDSLKSAIYSIGVHFFEEWKNEKKFCDSFRISSCFPFAKDEFFLPKPQLKRKIIISDLSEDKTSKKVKKIEFFEKTVFENFINTSNDFFKINLSNVTPNGVFVSKENIEQKKHKEFFKTEVQQRVKVPLEWENKDSDPFYIDRIYFEKECGLYFIAEFDNSEIENQVLRALKLLGENGIGTDRSVGNGLFNFNVDRDVSEFSFNINSLHDNYLLLGLYLPNENEHKAINFDKSSWSLIKRGGYIAGSEIEEFMHLRKKSVYMFGEGSILKSSLALKGKTENLSPDWNDEKMHPVWRDGQCLILKI
jgi:CRISPR type III-A-associated RAMP protein Csm4